MDSTLGVRVVVAAISEARDVGALKGRQDLDYDVGLASRVGGQCWLTTIKSKSINGPSEALRSWGLAWWRVMYADGRKYFCPEYGWRRTAETSWGILLETSRCHQNLNNLGERRYLLQVRGNVYIWIELCNTCSRSPVPRTRIQERMYQNNVCEPSKAIAIDIASSSGSNAVIQISSLYLV